jgi:hypothetical protein
MAGPMKPFKSALTNWWRTCFVSQKKNFDLFSADASESSCLFTSDLQYYAAFGGFW